MARLALQPVPARRRREQQHDVTCADPCGLRSHAVRRRPSGGRPSERLRAGAAERPADSRGRCEPAGQPRIEAAGAGGAAAAAERERLVQRREPGVLAHHADAVGPERSGQRPGPARHQHRQRLQGDQLRHHAAPDAVPLGSMGGAAPRRCAGRAGGSRLPGRAAGPDPADLAALLRRARRAGHRRCRASDARSVLAPARAGGQALRGRPDCHH